ncbi:MAG: hypothetical protein ACOYL8_03025 [Patescibacteria group bacterium]
MSQNKEKYIRWQVPEYKIPERGRNWYIIAAIFLFICIFFSFFTISNWRLVFLGAASNFLFVVILLIAGAIMYINERRDPLIVTFEIGPEGIKIGSKFYDYDELRSFCVLYKPKESIKQLYFDFKSSTKMRLSVPLRRMDALTVRNFLVRYLNEDLERENEPLSEQLTKLLKL